MYRWRRRLYWVIICTALFCILLNLFQSHRKEQTPLSTTTESPSTSSPTYRLPSILLHKPRVSKGGRQRLVRKKFIAFGTKLFGKWEKWLLYFRTSLFSSCEYKHCSLSSDVKRADALIFHSRDLFPSRQLPKVRQNTKQRWIYFSWESPVNVKKFGYNVFKDPGWRYLFNWTATYKRDADVMASYGASVKRTSEIPANQTDLHLSWHHSSSPYVRPKLIFALVSNCNRVRMRYLRKLKRLMGLQIYGKCGRPFPYKSIAAAAKDFYFYIAFENSRCKDYLTEKFWRNGLASGVVPVVIGGRREDYKKLAPPSSYVFADDFKSVHELAVYLRNESSDPTKYKNFFKWQTTHKLRKIDKAMDLFCRLCEKLFKDKSHKVVDLFSQWNTTDCENLSSV